MDTKNIERNRTIILNMKYIIEMCFLPWRINAIKSLHNLNAELTIDGEHWNLKELDNVMLTKIYVYTNKYIPEKLNKEEIIINFKGKGEILKIFTNDTLNKWSVISGNIKQKKIFLKLNQLNSTKDYFVVNVLHHKEIKVKSIKNNKIILLKRESYEFIKFFSIIESLIIIFSRILSISIIDTVAIMISMVLLLFFGFRFRISQIGSLSMPRYMKEKFNERKSDNIFENN